MTMMLGLSLAITNVGGGGGAGGGGLPNVASLVGFGDSITAGQVASDAAHQWLNIVSAALGAGTPLNQGIPGTVLQNSNDSGGSPLTNNGRDRYVADLLGANQREMAIIAYGFNDARYTAAPTTFNLAQYAMDYREILTGLIAGGYAANRICIVSPYYITDTGLATGSAGFTGQTRAVFQQFDAAAAALAKEFGVFYADAYAAMLAGGGASLISGDNIHPTDAGHAVIATAVRAATQQSSSVPAGLFTSDDFVDTDGTIITNHTGEKGASWLPQNGYTPATPNGIKNGRMWSPTATGVYRVAADSVGISSANYYVEAVLTRVSVLAGDNVGIIGRAQTSANTLYFARYNDTAGGWQLFKTVAGSSTQLGSTIADTFAAAAQKTLRLTMNGTTISVQVGGATIISVTDSAIASAGRPGCRFGFAQSDTTGIHLESLTAALL
ncbi:SGNH/GDSL hydrolase family protein [Rhizobium laguerreae]|uniref:SGNH/GDSL hydrolase family protein n=1 Tax=Rhizobium laguerreae TaxID=1076926 RepID=A0A7Y2RBB9_9HYPH|nr:SGNH/GDSL hydrolase family protein [Rhizobium laguerreae]NNH67839.1 SGNH/GDSL hydrolase family protein [Rhizobium laguerreae]